MDKPGIEASNKELISFVHDWIKLCANGKINEAFGLLDAPVDINRHTWSPEDIKEVTFDHFDDGQFPVISDPDNVEGTIRKDIIKYNDGSGWNVEYDLPLNGVVSDFTLMFDFIIKGNKLKVILDDCHVM